MNEKILNEVVKRLKRSDMTYQIKSYLKSQKLSDEEVETYLGVGKNRVFEQKLKRLPKIKKLLFFGLVTLAFVTFIAYVFVLPKMGIKATTTLAILGSVVFTLSSVYAWVYYKSWEKESVKFELENKKNDSDAIVAILMAAAIPAIVIFFIFSFILEKGKDDFLKRTQIETEGIIVSGSSTNVNSLKGGSVNFSSVTVAFLNQKGQKVHVTEDVSEYEFRAFYKGQKVKLIYSSEDEQNISLLVSKSDIAKFRGGEERDFRASDLIKLIELTKEEDILNYLNKVSYGWDFKKGKNHWENQAKNMVFVKNDYSITLITAGILAMVKFPKGFEQKGFKDSTEGKIKSPIFQSQRVLENEKYIFKIEKAKIINGTPCYTSTLIKK